MLDDRAYVRRVFLDQADHAITKWFAQLVPVTLAQRVRSVLQEDSHDVLAGRSERCVVHRGDGHLDQWVTRRMAIFRVIPGALHIVDRWANMHRCAMLWSRSPWKATEVRKA